MNVVPKKNVYRNTPDGKIKVLTKGKLYQDVQEFKILEELVILDDEGYIRRYKKSMFISQTESRNKKLEQLL